MACGHSGMHLYIAKCRSDIHARAHTRGKEPHSTRRLCPFPACAAQGRTRAQAGLPMQSSSEVHCGCPSGISPTSSCAFVDLCSGLVSIRHLSSEDWYDLNSALSIFFCAFGSLKASFQRALVARCRRACLRRPPRPSAGSPATAAYAW